MTSINSLRTQLTNYTPISPHQINVRATILMHLSADPQPPNEVLITRLREDLPVEVLYDQENIRGPSTLYRILRDYLVLNGLEYSQHEGSNRIVMGLPATLYESEAEKMKAYEAVSSCTTSASVAETSVGAMAGSVRGAAISDLRNNGHASSASSHQDNEMRRIAHSIALRFRSDDKFSGKLGKDLNEAINLYLDAANDYELNQEQRLKYFHNIFEGEARRFYRLKVSKRVPTFAEACVKMRSEFNSITRQNRVRKYLQGLRLSAIMRERSCSVTEALEELRETITKFAQQGPRNHRSEEDKVEYLYRAVVGHEWASNSLSQAIASEPADFQQMFTDLDSAWLQQQEETEGRKRDGIPQARYRTEQGSRLPGLYYEGQGFYAKPRKFNSKSSVPRGYRPTSNFQPNTSRRMNENNPGQNGLDKFGKIRKCHNCGSKDHFIRDCSVKGRNIATNVANMLRQNPNGAKQILYDLCLQTEDAFCNKEDHEAFFEEEEGKEETEGSTEEQATKETLYERLQEFDNQEAADEDDEENIDLEDF